MLEEDDDVDDLPGITPRPIILLLVLLLDDDDAPCFIKVPYIGSGLLLPPRGMVLCLRVLCARACVVWPTFVVSVSGCLTVIVVVVVVCVLALHCPCLQKVSQYPLALCLL